MNLLVKLPLNILYYIIKDLPICSIANLLVTNRQMSKKLKAISKKFNINIGCCCHLNDVWDERIYKSGCYMWIDLQNHDISDFLGYYAKYGHLGVVKHLHKHGADITANDNYAIRWAAGNGHIRVVEYLHEQGADITAENNHAICWAAENGHLSVVKYLQQNGADITAHYNKAIRQAIRNGHITVVKYLVTHNADITAANYEEIYHGVNKNPDIIEYLVNNEIDIHMNNNFILRKAIKAQNEELLNAIIKHSNTIKIGKSKYSILKNKK